MRTLSTRTCAICLEEVYGSRVSCHLTHLKKYASSASEYFRLKPGVVSVAGGGGVGEREGVAAKRTRWAGSARERERPRDELRGLANFAWEALAGRSLFVVVRPLGATRSSFGTIVACVVGSSPEEMRLQRLS